MKHVFNRYYGEHELTINRNAHNLVIARYIDAACQMVNVKR